MELPAKFSFFKDKRVHLGVCGSIAAYKAVELMRLLQQTRIGVNVTLTPSAQKFITPLTFESLDAGTVYTGMFGREDGHVFGHLAPGLVADSFVIAPASATTLARLAGGFADEMLAAQALSFTCPLVIAPAMNPRMWENTLTQANVLKLRETGHIFVLPEAGRVACGEKGQGKLAAPRDIYYAVLKSLCPQDLAGRTILVTLGPTREIWDGVRCWTNLSTGRMGASLVEAAYLRGAEVIAVAGPGVPRLPSAVVRHEVTSADEMFSAAQKYWPDADAGIFTAAVADFHPVVSGSGKFKKQAGQGLTLNLEPNPDILATLAAARSSYQKVIGFAAETDDLEHHVEDKLMRKKADMIVGNLVGQEGSGFAGQDNVCHVRDRSGRHESWPSMSKRDCAWRILDWLLTL